MRLIFGLAYPRRKNACFPLPEGAAIVCANHSHAIDPILIALTVGRKNPLHFMAKQELSHNAFSAFLLKKVGVFFVNRGGHDIGAIKTAMTLLKNGEKVGIFPEGTRVPEDISVTAKNGAIRIAMRMNVPIVPVFVSKKKKAFSPLDVVVGESYYVTEGDDITEQTAKLMEKIYALDPGRENR